MPRGRLAALGHGLLCPTGPVYEIAPRGGCLLLAPLYGNGVRAVLDAPIWSHAVFRRAQLPYGPRRLRAESRGSGSLHPRGLPIPRRWVAVLFFCGAAGVGFGVGRLSPLGLVSLRAAGWKVRSVDWGVRVHLTEAMASCPPGRSRRPSAAQPCGGVSAVGVSAALRLGSAQSVVHRTGEPAARVAGPEVSGLKPPASRMSRLASRRSPVRAPACRMCQASPIFPRALSRFRRGS
jgi:hypothetical protein